MTRLTRFAVAPLHTMTRRLADVASGRLSPDLVVTGATPSFVPSKVILDFRESEIDDRCSCEDQD